MHYLEKSPGMCSDRPGTNPKGLDLVVFPTCLREKERDTFGVCGRFGGEVKGTSNISQVWPTPRFCPVADCPRSFGGPSAYEIFYTATDWNCLCPNMRGPSAVLWRTVRNEFLRLTTSLQNLWWISPINGGLSAPYPRTVRTTKNLTSLNSANFLNSNSNLGSLLK